MTFIQDFYVALDSIPGAQVFPITAPEGTDFPLIIYAQQGADWMLDTGEGQAIYSGQKRFVVSVTCAAKTLAEAKALLKTVILKAMDMLVVTDVSEGPDAYDDDIKAYGSMCTLAFHARD